VQPNDRGRTNRRAAAAISRRVLSNDRPAWQRQGRQDNPIDGPVGPRSMRMSLYTEIRHPRLEQRLLSGPVKVIDQYSALSKGRFSRLDTWLAVKITAVVGTMICAYLFTILALISLPSALKTGQLIIIIAWIAQTFLQLVLLPIIIVGQNVQAAAADKRAEQTYEDADAILHHALEIQKHLQAQDLALQAVADKLGAKLEPAEQEK
jgi:hypothetical protein